MNRRALSESAVAYESKNCAFWARPGSRRSATKTRTHVVRPPTTSDRDHYYIDLRSPDTARQISLRYTYSCSRYEDYKWDIWRATVYKLALITFVLLPVYLNLAST